MICNTVHYSTKQKVT